MKSGFAYRGHRLAKASGSRNLYVSWTEAGTSITHRRSLGTADLEEAKDRLREFALKAGDVGSSKASVTSVAEVLIYYRERHVPKTSDPGRARLAIKQLTPLVGAMTVRDLTPPFQERLRRDLARGGERAGSTVGRILSVLSAALNFAHHQQFLADPPPKILNIEKSLGRDWVPTFDDLARLVVAFDRPYARDFFWLLVATAGRKRALLELTTFQVDRKLWRIDLNQPGRAQTKKRRPVLPVPEFIRPLVLAAQGPLVSRLGEPVADIKAPWRRAVAASGVDKRLTPHVIRHFIATELHGRGVPENQCTSWLGHELTNRTTERYTHVRPEFLTAALAAIEDIGNEIARKAGTFRAIEDQATLFRQEVCKRQVPA